jgi:FAD/FMN-containing dehydrogenase
VKTSNFCPRKPAAEIALMTAIKRTIDPQGIMSPRVLLAGK